MDRHKIISLIHTIENDTSIEGLNVNGVNVWPLIRIFIASELYRSRSARSDSRSLKANISHSMSSILGLGKGLFLSGMQIPKKGIKNIDIVFLTHSICRHYLGEVAWYDIFCDPYIDIFNSSGLTSISFETVPFQKYKLPRHRCSTFVQNHINYCLAKSKLVSAFGRYGDVSPNEDFFNILGDISTICEGYCIPNDGFSTEKIISKIRILFSLSNFFEHALARVRPSIAFLIGYYSLEGMAFCLACRKLNILSVDIQHGVQGRLHCAYAHWHKVPLKGYGLLPARFWCWGRTDKSLIDEWSLPSSPYHQSIAGGNLWLNLWKDDNHPMVRDYNQLVRKIKAVSGRKRHVLFTLQPISDPLPDWIISAMKATVEHTHWWIRLHPGMAGDRSLFTHLLQEHQIGDFELSRATDLPLHAMLRNMDLHVTQWSSTVLEANAFGVPSIITHMNGKDIFSEELSLGSAVLALTADALVSSLSSQGSQKQNINSSSRFSHSESAIQDIVLYAKAQRALLNNV